LGFARWEREKFVNNYVYDLEDLGTSSSSQVVPPYKRGFILMQELSLYVGRL
jgi:hypothetical protein